MTLQGVIKGHWTGERAEEEIRKSQENDEDVPRVDPQLLGREDDEQVEGVEGDSEEHDGNVDTHEGDGGPWGNVELSQKPVDML